MKSFLKNFSFTFTFRFTLIILTRKVAGKLIIIDFAVSGAPHAGQKRDTSGYASSALFCHSHYAFPQFRKITFFPKPQQQRHSWIIPLLPQYSLTTQICFLFFLFASFHSYCIYFLATLFIQFLYLHISNSYGEASVRK